MKTSERGIMLCDKFSFPYFYLKWLLIFCWSYLLIWDKIIYLDLMVFI